MGRTHSVSTSIDESDKEILRSVEYPDLGMQAELERIALLPRYTIGTVSIFGKLFRFHDGLSFAVTFREIFISEIYRFNPSEDNRTILDCGANIGLSVIFFGANYRRHTIVAFEPDEELFELLKENVAAFGLTNVELVRKAVWLKTDYLSFYTDGGMGGRVLNPYGEQHPKYVEAVPLIEFLSKRIDFLKIDIEGSECAVLKSCRGKLQNANHIFFEYHDDKNNKQSLHELLEMVQKEGFRYHLKESAVRRRPFVDRDLICESYEMAINVFCLST